MIRGRASAALAIAFCSSGCGSPPPQNVAEVIPQIRALDGKTVRVAGYLGACAGYECNLFVDEAGWKAYLEAFRQMRVALKEANGTVKSEAFDKPDFWPPHLGIGSGDEMDFDRKAARFTNGHVVVTGKITAMCRTENNEPGCTDRSTDLIPTDISAWSPPPAPPANTH